MHRMIRDRFAGFVALAGAALLLSSGAGRATDHGAALEAEVKAAERAFATTMANRDPKGFATFIAGEAVYFSEADGRWLVVFDKGCDACADCAQP